MKKIIVLMLAVIVLSTSSAFALNMTFFGEDLGPLTQSDPRPNADAARADFFTYLVGVGTEDFEGVPAGTTSPLTIDFGAAGTATLNGGGDVTSDTTYGAFPISGSKYWEASDTSFSLNFSDSIAAFGFYGTDIGDWGGTVTVTTQDGVSTAYEIPHTSVPDGSTSGSALYWGVIDTDNPFISITFDNTYGVGDWFGFDDFSIGSIEQVQPTIPEPGTLLLLGSGLIGLLALGRKKLSKK